MSIPNAVLPNLVVSVAIETKCILALLSHQIQEEIIGET